MVFSITSFTLLEYGVLEVFYLIVLKDIIHWDFPIASGQGKQIIYDEEDELQENDSEFLQWNHNRLLRCSTMVYKGG